SLRKIKDHDPDFSTKTFPEKAQEIFIEANNSLAKQIHPSIFPHQPAQQGRTLSPFLGWKTLKSHPMDRSTSLCPRSLQNPIFFGIFSQILAIYDRFGRLMYGGEEIPKDVLEYVVFERYLVNPYGTWRMHGKIIPEWAPPKDPIIKTVMIPGPAPDPSQEHGKAE
ncbi:RM45 protein, partial [Hylia prasina]|nr:RM45 protein [Hylia prasina]